MKNYTISVSTESDSKFIVNKLIEFNNSKVPLTQNPAIITKNYVLKQNNEIIAGINSYIYYWNIVYVERLYIDEKYRGQNLGRMLLQKIEKEASENYKCKLVHLETFDFQAKYFYLKQGYEIFASLESWSGGPIRYYLKKITIIITKIHPHFCA